MSSINYVEAIVIGALQGVSELFPVSSLGHSVLFRPWSAAVGHRPEHVRHRIAVPGGARGDARGHRAGAGGVSSGRTGCGLVKALLVRCAGGSVRTPDERLVWLCCWPRSRSAGRPGHGARPAQRRSPARCGGDLLALNGLVLYAAERECGGPAGGPGAPPAGAAAYRADPADPPEVIDTADPAAPNPGDRPGRPGGPAAGRAVGAGGGC